MSLVEFDPLRDDRWSAARVAAEAQAYLNARTAELAVEPEPEPVKPRIPKLPQSPDDTFLYVIASGALVKVGYAANLYVRFSNIKVDNPHGAELSGYWEMPKLMAKDVERFVHMAMQAHHASGEWFTVPAAEALAHVERVHAAFRDLYGVTAAANASCRAEQS